MHLFLAHWVVCAIMTGLIWVIQCVHYPMFAALHTLTTEQFKQWMAFHTSHITLIVGPLMLFEALTSVWLLLHPPKYFTVWVGVTNLVLVGVIFATTAFLSVPQHHVLKANGFNSDVINQLVQGNWVRTIAWSLRLLLLTGWCLGSLKK
jgi:hypothetical protein